MSMTTSLFRVIVACRRAAGFGGLMVLVAAAAGGHLVNPVARCADAGVMKHRGEYYISGTGLPRQMLVSPDLVHWRGPYRMMDREILWTTREDMRDSIRDVHAPCFRYVNGVFHLYWNGIGHAVARAPLGPYVEPVPGLPFDREIDPFLFADEDGAFYFITVKFDRGNQIWGQAMAGPDRLAGKPIELLEATPGSWETRHGNIVEGPEVVRYRDRYYLFYAANHTSVGYGQYAIGCAVAEKPLGFNEASKLPYPVLESNEFEMAEEAEILLRTGARGGPPWRYTTERPPDDWKQLGFAVPPSWKSGPGGFGWPVRPESRLQNVNTPWETGDLWLRCRLQLQRRPSPFLQVRIRHRAGAEIFFNGVLAHKAPWWVGPRLLDVPIEAVQALRAGENVIAVHVHAPTHGERYFDLGLLDPRDHHTDDLVWNTGQPNIVRGPNGFEWFMVYFGMWNEGPHCQGINRVFFFGGEPHVDGPTGGRPSQYQPEPYAPTFADRFDTHRMDQLGERWGQSWEYAGGLWHVEEGEARVSRGWDFHVPPSGTARAFVRAPRAAHYLFSVGVRSLGDHQAPYGMVAWHRNEQNWLRITLDPKNLAWRRQTCREGTVESAGHALPANFDFSVEHTLRLVNNGGLFDLWIDQVRVAETKRWIGGPMAPGRVGLLSEGALAAYDGVLYTIGWDEYGSTITDWQVFDGLPEKAKSRPGAALRGGPNGLSLDASSGRTSCWKGEVLDEYEFMVHVSAEKIRSVSDVEPRMGIYALYADPRNYLYAEVDPVRHLLVVRGRCDGEAVEPRATDLGGRRRLFSRFLPPRKPRGVTATASHCFERDSVEAVCDGRVSRSSQARLPKHTFWPHRGTREWIQLDFEKARTLDGAEVIWYDDRRTNGGCRVPAAWELQYRHGKAWHSVVLRKNRRYGTKPDVLNVVRFTPVTTTALRMIVHQQEGYGSGIYEWSGLEDGVPDLADCAVLNMKRSAWISGLSLRFDTRSPYALPVRVTVTRTDKMDEPPLAVLTLEDSSAVGEEVIIRFDPVETRKLGVRMNPRPGAYVHLWDAHAEVSGQRSYDLRAVKLQDRVLLLVDGKQRLDISRHWPSARVGLTARGMRARFDDITCFRIDTRH